MKRLPVAFSLFLLSAFLSLPACKTVGTPPTGTPSADGGTSPSGQLIDCLKGVAPADISAAVAKIDTVVAEGGTQASIETNLEQLLTSVAPSALACGYEYLATKFGFDAAHAPADIAPAVALKATIAKDMISKHGWVFAPVSGP